MTNEPLIYTIRGNEPISGLRLLTPEWQFKADENGNLFAAQMVEEWVDKETGESVKRSVHLWQREGVAASGELG